MTSDVNASRRPNLEPIWTDYRGFGAVHKPTTYRTPGSSGWSPSSLSPRALPSPSPIHPASYDGSMRRQDRALVSSLDQRTKHVVNPVPLTPIDEQSPSPLVARLEKISILPHLNVERSLPTPSSPGFSREENQRIAERTRSVDRTYDTLLEKIRRPSYATGDRHTLPDSPRKNSALELQDQLRKWGHVYYGNAKTADAFIIARSLRRPSHSHSRASSIDSTGRDSAGKGASAEGGQPSSNRLTVRAIVRPRSIDRSSFLIQRNFNLDELRATIPDPPTRSQQRRGSGALEQQPQPPSPPISTQQPSIRRSSNSVRSSTLLRSGANGLDLESLVRDAKAVPIRKFLLCSSYHAHHVPPFPFSKGIRVLCPSPLSRETPTYTYINRPS